MQVKGIGTIGDLVGDLVAYRSLRPCDPRLHDLPLPAAPPRKIQPEYACVVGQLIRSARRLDAPRATIHRLIVVGDNGPSDGAAFDNLCAANNWQGHALIVAECAGEAAAHAQPRPVPHGIHWALSGWSLLRDWARSAAAHPVDEATAVLLDVDKTLLGARGRNDGVIDAARSRAMRAICAEVAGPDFDPAAFDAARQTFNQPTYHRLTGDNQDLVAYLCLLVSAGVFELARLARSIQNRTIASVADLATAAGAALGEQTTPLLTMQRVIAERIRAGDPTPFKEFRAREYQETIACMGRAGYPTVEHRLADELVLTGEVLETAAYWQQQGALLFALSDKPDEAAIPTAELARQGYRPLHWTPTHIVGNRG